MIRNCSPNLAKSEMPILLKKTKRYNIAGKLLEKFGGGPMEFYMQNNTAGWIWIF
jgi:hypothetical protein